MKSLILGLSLLSAFSVFAAKPECPYRSTTVLSCVSEAKSSNHPVAESVFTNAVICRDFYGDFTISTNSKTNPKVDTTAAEKVVRPGATSYEFSQGSAKFAIVEMYLGRPVHNFSIYMGGQHLSAALNCRR